MTRQRKGPPPEQLLAAAPVKSLIWTFALPAILSQVVGAMHNIVDQTFIGWGLGDVAIAATNIAFPLATLTTALAGFRRDHGVIFAPPRTV